MGGSDARLKEDGEMSSVGGLLEAGRLRGGILHKCSLWEAAPRPQTDGLSGLLLARGHEPQWVTGEYIIVRLVCENLVA